MPELKVGDVVMVRGVVEMPDLVGEGVQIRFETLGETRWLRVHRKNVLRIEEPNCKRCHEIESKCLCGRA